MRSPYLGVGRPGVFSSAVASTVPVRKIFDSLAPVRKIFDRLQYGGRCRIYSGEPLLVLVGSTSCIAGVETFVDVVVVVVATVAGTAGCCCCC